MRTGTGNPGFSSPPTDPQIHRPLLTHRRTVEVKEGARAEEVGLVGRSKVTLLVGSRGDVPVLVEGGPKIKRTIRVHRVAVS